MRFLLLAALGLGATSVLGGVWLERGAGPPAAKPACPALAGRLATADRIELTHAGQVLWLERRGAVWGLARQGGYPVQPGRAEALIRALLTLELLRPAPGTLPATQPGSDAGTLVRIMGLSGAVLCAVVAGPPGSSLARRQSDSEGWIANGEVPASADPDTWSQHTLPPPSPPPSPAPPDGSAGEAAAQIAAIAFTDVRPRPQIHLAPLRTMRLALAGGNATLTVGTDAGTAWLVVDGTAPWARQLAPYAFALPAGNTLAVP